jgi:hypothetical protein
MIYVSTLTWRRGIAAEQMDEALKRRAEYEFPKGLKRLGEYWPAGPIIVTLIFEVDSFAPVMQFITDWHDVFDIAVYPATTAEEGLALGAEALRRRKAA